VQFGPNIFELAIPNRGEPPVVKTIGLLPGSK